MEWSDRQQFDVILVNSVGPMGLCGWLASRMLRAPMIAVSHDDLPAQMLEITGGDYRLTAALEKYIAWLYRGAAYVLTGGQSAAKISGIRPLRSCRRTIEWNRSGTLACVRNAGRKAKIVTNPMEAVRA